MEEFLQRSDTLFRLLALALPGRIDAPDIPGEAGKARRSALADIPEIRRVYDRETRAVRHVEERGERMLNAVALPVGLFPVIEHAAERKAARPHKVRPRLIVRGFHDGSPRRGDLRAHGGLGEIVREGIVVRRGDIKLHQVRHGVHNAVHHLVFRQTVCERRVKNGKAGKFPLAVIAVFLACGEICDNGGLVQLAARGRNGENDAERDTGFGALPVYIKLFPEVALRRCSHGDGLGAVDRAAAADGKNEVDLKLPAKLDALVHLFGARVRHDAGELIDALPRRAQRIKNAVIEAGALDAAAAIGEQDICAELAQLLRQMAHGVRAEVDAHGIIIHKIVHGSSPFPECPVSENRNGA